MCPDNLNSPLLILNGFLCQWVNTLHHGLELQQLWIKLLSTNYVHKFPRIHFSCIIFQAAVSLICLPMQGDTFGICNMGARGLPDMFMVEPRPFGVYIRRTLQ